MEPTNPKVAVFCPAEHRRRVERAVGAEAAIETDWSCFEAATPRVACLVLILSDFDYGQATAILALRQRHPHTPMLLSFEPTESTLNRLATLQYDGFVASSSLDTALRSAVQRLVGMSIRLRAARILCERIAHSSICVRIVQQAFLADAPLASERQLANLLGVTLGALRYHWRQHARSILAIPLLRLLRWARVFRAAELLQRRVGPAEVAVLLGVDESTLSRDRRQLVAHTDSPRGGNFHAY